MKWLTVAKLGTSGFAPTSAPTLPANSSITINLSQFIIPAARRDGDELAARREPIVAARRDALSAARRMARCSLFLKFGMFPAYALRMAL